MCTVTKGSPTTTCQSRASLYANDLRSQWLDEENVTIVLQKEQGNSSFFFVEDAPAAGIDPVRTFLQRAESHVRDLYHHLLYTPNCEQRDPENLWGTTCSSTRKDAERKQVVIDVGANRGYYALLAATYGHEVIAFEPQPHCLTLLQSCILLNGYSCMIDMKHAFVSDKVDSTMNIRKRTGCTGTFPNDNHDGWADSFRKPLQYLKGADDLVEVGSLKLDVVVDSDVTVLLMKIDVEGHEESVLKSGKQLIDSGRVNNLLIEFNIPMLKRQETGWEDMKTRTIQEIKRLHALGYKSKASVKGHWTHQGEMTDGQWVLLFEEGTFVTVDAWFYKALP